MKSPAIIALTVIIVLGLTGCGRKEAAEEEIFPEIDGIQLHQEESSCDYDGSFLVVLTGYGVVLDLNVELMEAQILLDKDCSSFAGRTMLFDFSKHTEHLPVLLDQINVGDRVKVTFFNANKSETVLMGESLIPFDSDIAIG